MGWSKKPTAFVKAYEKAHGELTQKVAIEFWSRVTDKTPVDTGTARANWHMTFEFKSNAVTDETDPQEPNKMSTVPPYPVFYVQNALKYIMPLEFGHSKQAPMGMFRLTLAEFL